MSTKAQTFRAEAQRTHAKTKVAKRPKRVVDLAHSETRNVTRRGDKAVGMAMEDSVSKNGTPARPSRKSTRASANHGRADTTLMRTAREKTFTARARANHR